MTAAATDRRPGSPPAPPRVVRPRVFLLVLALMAPPCTAVAGGGVVGRVIHVAAGDRLTVATGRGEMVVRLAHVRAPPRDHFYWSRARRALGELAFGRVVAVRVHRREAGAVTAAVAVNGTDVAARLVAQGLLRTAVDAPSALRARESEARRLRRGMWGSGVAVDGDGP